RRPRAFTPRSPWWFAGAAVLVVATWLISHAAHDRFLVDPERVKQYLSLESWWVTAAVVALLVVLAVAGTRVPRRLGPQRAWLAPVLVSVALIAATWTTWTLAP